MPLFHSQFHFDAARRTHVGGEAVMQKNDVVAARGKHDARIGLHRSCEAIAVAAGRRSGTTTATRVPWRHGVWLLCGEF